MKPYILLLLVVGMGMGQEKDSTKSVVASCLKPTGVYLECGAKREAPEVPAIKHKDSRFSYCGRGGVTYCDHGEHFAYGDRTPICQDTERHCGETVITCADKSRILEHDENSPPKYWCRKVHTE